MSWIVALVLSTGQVSAGESKPPGTNGGTYALWQHGPPQGADYFPIAVWLQDPKNAPRYQAIGINLYVGLWKGPTEPQLAELKRQGMPAVCSPNDYALKHLDEKIIVGWMHGDEPDNAQSQGEGKGYGPPIAPGKIIEHYRRIKARDPSRPVLLNLGQGAAWDGWHGRGVRSNHPEDYAEYVRGGDLVSFDIYPAVHSHPAVAGKLWYVAYGVQRLRQWTRGEKVVWNCIECTHVGNAATKPTPQQVKAEVWMSIIHGSRGIVYFAHQFQPRFIEAGLLADEEMAQAVGAINAEIRALAAVINSAAAAETVTVEADPAEAPPDRARALGTDPIATLLKRQGRFLYLFSVRMEARPARAVFQVPGWGGTAAIEVIGQRRVIQAEGGRFEDHFGPYAVHLYKIPAVAAAETGPEKTLGEKEPELFWGPSVASQKQFRPRY